MGAAVDRLIYLSQVKAHTRKTKAGKVIQVRAYENSINKVDEFGNRFLHFKPPPGVTVEKHVMSRAYRAQLKAEADAGTWKNLAAFHEDTPNGNNVMVARDPSGRIIGAVEYWHHYGDAYVKSLHVDDTTRSKGVGTYLMQKVAQETLARPKGHLRDMYVSGALVSAEPFYERLGGTSLSPAQVKALAEGHPVTQTGGGTGMGTYEQRLKAYGRADQGYIVEVWPENARKWRHG